jgi:hypothetical protein
MTLRLAGAFYRAWRDGKPVVGTEYLLEELAAAMPSLRRRLTTTSFEREPPVRRRVRACLRHFHTPETSSEDVDLRAAAPGVGFDVSALLREAAWKARRRMTAFRAFRGEATAAAPAWSDGVRAAVRSALVDARYVGVRHAHGMHLLVSILDDPHAGAAELVALLGKDPATLLVGLPVSASIRQEAESMAPTADALLVVGVLTTPHSSALRLLGRLLGTAARVRSRTGNFLHILMEESVRQAVRLGGTQVSQAHLIVALCAVEDQFRYAGRRLADRWTEYNCGGEILLTWGVDCVSSAARAARLPEQDVSACQRWRWRVGRGDPPYGVDVTQAIERAEQYAAQLGHPYTGTSHLLMAILSDQDAAGCRLLRDMEIDDDALRRNVACQLGLPGAD